MLAGLTMLLLAAGEPTTLTVADPAKVRLTCREEVLPLALLSRRRLCLTDEQWEERSRRDQEAARRSVYELMGDTSCMNGGICTSD